VDGRLRPGGWDTDTCDLVEFADDGAAEVVREGFVDGLVD
jgi:hypothetical protein